MCGSCTEDSGKCVAHILNIFKKMLKSPRTYRYDFMRRLFCFPLHGNTFRREPAIVRIDLDPDRFSIASRCCHERAPASHERVKHGVANKGEEFHAAQGEFYREWGRMADPGLALAVKRPQAVGPFHESVQTPSI